MSRPFSRECLVYRYFFFFFNDTATTEIYTLSLHDALPIRRPGRDLRGRTAARPGPPEPAEPDRADEPPPAAVPQPDHGSRPAPAVRGRRQRLVPDRQDRRHRVPLPHGPRRSHRLRLRGPPAPPRRGRNLPLSRGHPRARYPRRGPLRRRQHHRPVPGGQKPALLGPDLLPLRSPGPKEDPGHRPAHARLPPRGDMTWR